VTRGALVGPRDAVRVTRDAGGREEDADRERDEPVPESQESSSIWWACRPFGEWVMSKKRARHHRKLSKTTAPARGGAKPTRLRRERGRVSIEPMPLTVVAPAVEPAVPPDSCSAITLRSPPSTLPVRAMPTALSAKSGRWLSSAWTLVALAVVVFALFVWCVADLQENPGPAVAGLVDSGGLEAGTAGAHLDAGSMGDA
jgi:hypothetical protein